MWVVHKKTKTKRKKNEKRIYTVNMTIRDNGESDRLNDRIAHVLRVENKFSSQCGFTSFLAVLFYFVLSYSAYIIKLCGSQCN